MRGVATFFCVGGKLALRVKERRWGGEGVRTSGLRGWLRGILVPLRPFCYFYFFLSPCVPLASNY